jgi:hypothetical protein
VGPPLKKTALQHVIRPACDDPWTARAAAKFRYGHRIALTLALDALEHFDVAFFAQKISQSETSSHILTRM